MLTQTLALQMWCLAIPPPKMIIPVELAATAMLFILDMSEVKHVSLDQLKVHLQMIAPVQKKREVPSVMSRIKPGLSAEKRYRKSPIAPSVRAGLNTGMSFCNATPTSQNSNRTISSFPLSMHSDHCGWKHMSAGVHLVGPVAHRFSVVDLLS